VRPGADDEHARGGPVRGRGPGAVEGGAPRTRGHEADGGSAARTRGHDAHDTHDAHGNTAAGTRGHDAHDAHDDTAASTRTRAAGDGVVGRFEAERGRLWAVAYRMLGSAAEAEDAVQETWLRLGRVEVDGVANLAGWLRTVVSRVCLDMLRSRAARREELVGGRVPDGGGEPARCGDPEREALLAEAVGRALLVVLDRLAPSERIAFVLHDMFAVPFEEVAGVVDRSPVAAKKLASRARQKVRGNPAAPAGELARHRRVVEAFVAAARTGDVAAILAVLDPEVERRADRAALPADRPARVNGARAVAGEIAVFGTNARLARPALVDGDVGLLIAPRGRLLLALAFEFRGERVAAYDLVADPARLRGLDLAVLDG
jgi:RNA polymerase sigma-70 factor (ECF subfamily)